ncbi:guanylate cyclase domain-containing protein [Haematococcus lacustris]|uniref:Guanylate cyclase domain-containing protein n=1 Tax=Haematococcus lacustris TaxID=44745 RepID=A0A699ZN89_HAELA|nr:guanylate cyclase domain-containing protein [Haematococcus lacustris]
MSQRMDPGQIMLLLDHVYSLFDDLLEHHDCYKVETIGVGAADPSAHLAALSQINATS